MQLMQALHLGNANLHLRMKTDERSRSYLDSIWIKRCVSMDAKSAMAPTNFEKDAFCTHEVLKSSYT